MKFYIYMHSSTNIRTDLNDSHLVRQTDYFSHYISQAAA